MIKSFKDACAKAISNNVTQAKASRLILLKAARRKLILLDSAHVLNDLRAVPSNHLEALKGDGVGTALDQN